MITSLNEWKRQKKTKNVKSVNNSNKIIIESNDNSELSTEIDNIVNYAMDFGMSKSDTIGMVSKIFIDPAQVPDDISVAFVQTNLEEIIKKINEIPDTQFNENPLTFTSDMEKNDLPFECVMYVENNDKINKLTNILNTQIQKENFKTIYENNIFFINSLDKLNEKNRNVVMNILNECNAKNISTQLKWKRKL